jgi:hypothetical protein
MVLLASSISILAACGDPTIDGKNEATLEQSMTEIVTELSQEEARQFSQDLAVLSAEVMKELGGMSLESIQEMGDLMLKKLDGKSASDVHKMAEAVRDQN